MIKEEKLKLVSQKLGRLLQTKIRDYRRGDFQDWGGFLKQWYLDKYLISNTRKKSCTGLGLGELFEECLCVCVCACAFVCVGGKGVGGVLFLVEFQTCSLLLDWKISPLGAFSKKIYLNFGSTLFF